MDMKIKSEIPKIIILFLIWRIGLAAVAYFSYYNFPNFPLTKFFQDLHPAISMWMPYDAGWYVQIARDGYAFSPQATAFLPLWPMAIWLASHLLFFLDSRVVAFLTANLITLACCIAFYKLARVTFDEEISYRAVKYFLFFPMSLFLATGYTEPLFLLMVFLGFYFFIRKKYLLGGIFAALAGATRVVGVMMIIPLLIEALTQKIALKERIKAGFSALIAPLGLVAYMVYLKIKFNDPLKFIHAQADWHRRISFEIFAPLVSNLKTLFSFHIFAPDGGYITAIMQLGFLLFFLVVLLAGFKKISRSYFVYGLAVLLLPLLSGTLLSMSRLVYIAFPIFIVLAIWGKKRWVDETITAFFLLFLALFTAMFVNGYWVA